MNNLGIAKVKVQLYNSAPKIDKGWAGFHFDITAHDWNVIKSSPVYYPLLIEEIHDENFGFAALHPSKRKMMVDNFMAGTIPPQTGNAITWTPITTKANCSGVFKAIIDHKTDTTKTTEPTAAGESPVTTTEKTIDYDDYPNSSYVNINSSDIPNDWKGPVWDDKTVYQEPANNDTTIINNFLQAIGSSQKFTGNDCLTSTAKSNSPTIAQKNSVFQRVVRDGLWWGIRSNPWMTKANIPFWVTIKKPVPPTSSSTQSCILIRMAGGANNSFDLLITTNQKPQLIDYKMPPAPTQTSSNNNTATGATIINDVGLQIEIPNEEARILPTTERLEIGFMTVAGRLVVYINGNSFVYTRNNKDSSSGDSSSLLACDIPSGSIEIYGTNVQALINLSPMTFAPLGSFVVPVAKVINIANDAANYSGVNFDGSVAPSVCHLPTPPSVSQQKYGCDCRSFSGDGGDATPSGIGMHQLGKVEFRKGSSSTFPNFQNVDFYFVNMTPENNNLSTSSDGSAANGINICYGGCPYFFALKGKFEQETNVSQVATDISGTVISVDETENSPDYFHIKKSATITIYDPGGAVAKQVTSSQKAISISWGWNTANYKSFIGVVTNATTNQIAGKEITTLSCEDYMYILKNSYIINSPFYDGMVAFYAIKDIVKRMGLGANDIINGFPSGGPDYFLPAGFSFSAPVMRFQSKQTLFDCLMEIVKRYEAYVYFDADAKFHVDKLPGGIFSAPDNTLPSAIFSSDPSLPVANSILILGERSVDFNYDSTFSNITVITLDRDTKDYITLGKGASPSHLVYKKVLLLDQPAYGAVEPARAHMEDLAKRVFFPIIKTRWKTSGIASSPLSFVTVDGHMFRVMSIKKTFNAENNDFSSSYEAEWLLGI